VATESTTDTTITGRHLLGGDEQDGAGDVFRAVDPRTGEETGPAFREASRDQVLTAVDAAVRAAPGLAALDDEARATLLEAMADALEADRPALVEVADRESALGTPRLEGELSRTTFQLRAFAAHVREGSYLGAIIDPADPDAQPVPRPDLRRIRVPVGPVAVFGASNFPFAFSVPGGDTASALAAGCPVVVKGHPSHPGTSELTARALRRAAAGRGAPDGTVSLVQGRTPDVGQALVTAPGIRAVGFTGSEPAGRALFDLGASRPDPIPVYAEMGSLNPVFVTSTALERRADAIAEGLTGSFTLGNGQFCTKPGLVFVPDDAADRLLSPLAEAVGQKDAPPMLNPGIAASLDRRLDASRGVPGVEVIAHVDATGEGTSRGATVLATDLDTFLANDQLREEHFGPVTIVVRSDPARWASVADQLPGSLTATLQAEEDDADELRPLLRTIGERAGRILWNGYPTGVSVTAAQHHGGPYPATTTPAHTSVGATAIDRWLRTVTYQGWPDALLPPALQDANPLGLLRRVDGRWTRNAVDR
jgi:acyl-CoA reductase-like NAD-dependent aldehyde dehydrogenase